MQPRTFCLHFNLCAGDLTVLSALVRDIKLAHPQHRVFVECKHAEIFHHNPHGKPASGVVQAYPGVEHIKVDYGAGIHGDGDKKGPPGQKYRPVHFQRWLYEDFARKSGLEVPITKAGGDFHFSDEEAAPALSGRYWVMMAGGKSDFPVKVWDPARFQEVADSLRAMGLGVVQLGNTGTYNNIKNTNPKLSGVVDLVGQTSLRDMIRIIRDAEGVVCGVTAAMHMAAALERPCVAIAGGREAWWWEAYARENHGLGGAESTIRVPHKYLHTIGLLDCVEHQGGCWKRYVDPRAAQGRCLKPAAGESGPLPECMRLITVGHVLEGIVEYYKDGTLPPISTAPQPLAGTMASVAQPEMDRMRLVFPEEPQVLSLAGRLGRVAPATVADADPFDDPIIGGRFTVFMLLYGDYPAMHREALGSLLATIPAGRAEVRVISNDLCTETDHFVHGLMGDGAVARHFVNPDNIGKYPAMRRAFHNADFPIATNYVVWLDDDTICNKAADWMTTLARTIVAEHPRGCRLFGPAYTRVLSPEQIAWVKAAPWYLGVPFCDQRGREVANGNKVRFATGSLWALATAVIQAQDIPDARLAHNGGDYMVGAAVAQGGWKLKEFSDRKSLVNWSAYDRRGRSEPHIDGAMS